MTSHRLAPMGPSSPLGVPVFRSIWVASMVSHFGGLIQLVGASWIMLKLSGSPMLVTLVQTSTSLPIMLVSLWSGALADRVDRRLQMIVAQSFMLLVSAALVVTAWQGWLTPWMLLSFTFAIGCGAALHAPAWHASVGELVPRSMLPAAIAYNSMGFNVARSAGPAVGGLLVAAAGASMAFLANAISYLGLIVVLLRWRPDRSERESPKGSIGAAVLAGIGYAIHSPPQRRVMIRAVLLGIGAAGVPALTPLVARHLLSGGAVTYGILLGSFGLGAVFAALCVRWLRRLMSGEWLVRCGALALASGAFVLCLGNSLLASAPAMVVAGCGWVVALSTLNVTVQLSTPRWVLARSLAMYQMMAYGGMAIGSWLAGAVASWEGVRLALAATASMTFAGAWVGLALPLPEVDDGRRILSPDEAL